MTVEEFIIKNGIIDINYLKKVVRTKGVLGRWHNKKRLHYILESDMEVFKLNCIGYEKSSKSVNSIISWFIALYVGILALVKTNDLTFYYFIISVPLVIFGFIIFSVRNDTRLATMYKYIDSLISDYEKNNN